MGNIVVISKLAAEVCAAFKDAPDDYSRISEDVMPLQVILNMAVQHFESTIFSDNDQHECQEVLQSCRSVLEYLNSFIKKYNSLDFVHTSQVLERVSLGAEDIATLKARLISSTYSLHSFIQRFDISSTTI